MSLSLRSFLARRYVAGVTQPERTYREVMGRDAGEPVQVELTMTIGRCEVRLDDATNAGRLAHRIATAHRARPRSPWRNRPVSRAADPEWQAREYHAVMAAAEAAKPEPIVEPVPAADPAPVETAPAAGIAPVCRVKGDYFHGGVAYGYRTLGRDLAAQGLPVNSSEAIGELSWLEAEQLVRELREVGYAIRPVRTAELHITCGTPAWFEVVLFEAGAIERRYHVPTIEEAEALIRDWAGPAAGTADAADAVPVEPAASCERIDRNEAIRAIRAALKRRSGKTWSVTGGRGTDWGWISIGAPPRRCGDCGKMTAEDAAELGELLGLDRPAHHQGESVPASTDYYREYVARAEGRTPSVHGTQYWD